jgi:hypothetical protein
MILKEFWPQMQGYPGDSGGKAPSLKLFGAIIVHLYNGMKTSEAILPDPTLSLNIYHRDPKGSHYF